MTYETVLAAKKAEAALFVLEGELIKREGLNGAGPLSDVGAAFDTIEGLRKQWETEISEAIFKRGEDWKNFL